MDAQGALLATSGLRWSRTSIDGRHLSDGSYTKGTCPFHDAAGYAPSNTIAAVSVNQSTALALTGWVLAGRISFNDDTDPNEPSWKKAIVGNYYAADGSINCVAAPVPGSQVNASAPSFPALVDAGKLGVFACTDYNGSDFMRTGQLVRFAPPSDSRSGWNGGHSDYQVQQRLRTCDALAVQGSRVIVAGQAGISVPDSTSAAIHPPRPHSFGRILNIATSATSQNAASRVIPWAHSAGGMLPAGYSIVANTLKFGPKNSMFVVGYNGQRKTTALFKFSANGDLSPTFGVNGAITIANHRFPKRLEAVAVGASEEGKGVYVATRTHGTTEVREYDPNSGAAMRRIKHPARGEIPLRVLGMWVDSKARQLVLAGNTDRPVGAKKVRGGVVIRTSL